MGGMITENSNVPIVKIWITRRSAFQLQCGGLERLDVHFSEPRYYFEKLTDRDRDMPFGDILESEGLFKRIGWQSTNHMIKDVSFGRVFGYGNDFSDLVWSKVKEHFLNKPFDQWADNEESKIEDFILMFELKINFKLEF